MTCGNIAENDNVDCLLPAGTLTGGSKVYGKGWSGVGSNSTAVVCVTGGSTLYGGSGSLVAAKDMTSVSDPGGGSAMGALNLSNGVTRTIAGGNYRYSSINLTGGSKLIFSGQVILHIDGNISVSNGSSIQISSGGVILYMNGQKIDLTGGAIVNVTQASKNFIIYGSPLLTSVKLTGGANLHGLLHAPMANISLTGGQQTFGAMVGDTIIMSNGAAVHYDESLATGP